MISSITFIVMWIFFFTFRKLLSNISYENLRHINSLLSEHFPKPHSKYRIFTLRSLCGEKRESIIGKCIRGVVTNIYNKWQKANTTVWNKNSSRCVLIKNGILQTFPMYIHTFVRIYLWSNPNRQRRNISGLSDRNFLNRISIKFRMGFQDNFPSDSI